MMTVIRINFLSIFVKIAQLKKSDDTHSHTKLLTVHVTVVVCEYWS
jgi:hypothetical protein